MKQNTHTIFHLELKLIKYLYELWIKITSQIYCSKCNTHKNPKCGFKERTWKKMGYVYYTQKYKCSTCPNTYYNIYSNTKYAYKHTPPIILAFRFLRLQIKLYFLISMLIEMLCELKYSNLVIRVHNSLLKIDFPPEIQVKNQLILSADYIDTMIFFFNNCLNEVQRRLFAGLMVIQIGYGGQEIIHNILGIWPKTIKRGISELNNKSDTIQLNNRLRRVGAGRIPLTIIYPKFIDILDDILEKDIAGDPMNGVKWIRRSLSNISNILDKLYYIEASPPTISKYLILEKYSLKVNSKSIALTHDPQRNEQFEHIFDMRDEFIKNGLPVISLDSKKNELIGNFKEDGTSWQKEPYEVYDHEFPDIAIGKFTMYGIYDVSRNKGWINGGTNSKTAEYAVDTLIWWWEENQEYYGTIDKILLLCDCGGENSCHSHLWKNYLQTKFANRFRITVYITHYPPGASKWNPIEHRLFSFISINWLGVPKNSYELVLNYIRTTTTAKGLEVFAKFTDKKYETGLKTTKEERDYWNINYYEPNQTWNYSISPQDSDTKNYLKLRQNKEISDTEKSRYKGGKPPLYWLKYYFKNSKRGSRNFDVSRLILKKNPSNYGIAGKEWTPALLIKVCAQIGTKEASQTNIHRFLNDIRWKKTVEKLPLKDGKSPEWWLKYYYKNKSKGTREYDVSHLILHSKPSDYDYEINAIWEPKILSEVCKNRFKTKFASKESIYHFLRDIRWGKHGNVA